MILAHMGDGMWCAAGNWAPKCKLEAPWWALGQYLLDEDNEATNGSPCGVQ